MKKVESFISQFLELDIAKVYPNPNQPRKNFENIDELAKTIKESGLLNPITVVKNVDDTYMILAGERRYRAHLHNKSKTINVNVLNVDDHRLKELVLIENIQRDDLTDFEKAKYIGSLWATGLYEKKQHLAIALGKSASYISKCFSCLKLDKTIIDVMETNSCDVSLSVLEEISRVKDKNLQCEIYDKYVTKKITRDEIKDYKDEKFPAGNKNKIQKNLTSNNDIEKELIIAENERLKQEILDLKTKLSNFNNLNSENIYVSYGFGTQNDLGTYIAINDGAFTGTIEIENNRELIKHSNNRNYKITIEELTEEKTPIQENKIKLIEICSDSVYFEYIDFDSYTLSFNKAKNLIKESNQIAIPYTISGTTEKAYDFINNISRRSQINGELVLKSKYQ